jgi:hypothetical protein
MKRTDYLWILAAALAWYGIFLAWETSVNGRAFAGLPLDDGWIHAQFARNIAHGSWFTFTDGIPVAGETTPLWPLIAGVLFALFGDAQPAMILRVLSGLSYAAVGVATAMLTFRIMGRRRHALAAGIAAVSIGEVAWLGQSGMEAALFSALLLWAIRSHVSDSGRMSLRTGILFGACSVARPEGYALFFLALAHVWWMRRERSFADRVRPLLGATGMFLALVLPYVIFCFIIGGVGFPNSYYAKHTPVDLHFIAEFLYYFHGILFSANPIVWIIAIGGMIALISNRGVNPAAVFAVVPVFVFPFVSALAGGQSQTRYFAPFIPVVVVLAAVGVRALTRLPIHPRRGRRIALAVTLSAFAWSIMGAAIVHVPPQRNPRGSIPMASQFAWSVHNINEQQVAAAKWISDHVPAGEPVAANDVGAIGYFSGHRVIDLCGLTSTGVMHMYRTLGEREARAHLLDSLAAIQRPRHLALYINWFPGWRERLPVDTSFTIVAHQNTICGDDTMTVMRVSWNRYSRR